jgi:hypothetical protein
MLELPNLNYGLNISTFDCSIHPSIVPNILNHYLRRPEKNEFVVGTLLGNKDGSQVDIQTSFSVPLSINEQDGILLDKEFLAKMLKFHKKVNPKEGLIGLYFSSLDINKDVAVLFNYYTELMKDKKNKPVLP